MSELSELWRIFFESRIKRKSDLVTGYLVFIDQCSERGLPPIFEERHLSLLIGVDYREMAYYLTSSTGRYRQFRIPKRLGGSREINVPTPMLLAIQQWILSSILYKLPINDAAHGGVPGRSIFTNAKPHLSAKSLLKMDLKNFFDTVRVSRGIRIFEAVGYSPRLSRSLALLCFEAGKLPQGAATSSALANLSAASMDRRLNALAKKYELTYTRYVDDLTFSGHSIGTRFTKIVEGIVHESGFIVNLDKTRLMRGPSPKFVTGLAVGGNQLRVPRAFKREVKNRAFQLLTRGVENHLQATDSNDPLVIEKLLGKLAFWLQAEPNSNSARQLFESLATYRRSMVTSVKLPNPTRIELIEDNRFKLVGEIPFGADSGSGA